MINPTLEHHETLCARCAQLQRTCCQDTEIYVTRGDVERIALHTGRDDFYQLRMPDNPSYGDQDDDPIWRDHVFRQDGSRRVLKWVADQSCVFLGQRGCQLPLDVRPLVCRLYPLEYTAAGIQREPAAGCPLQLIPLGSGLIETLGINSEDAQRWHEQLYQEIKQEPCTIATQPDVYGSA